MSEQSQGHTLAHVFPSLSSDSDMLSAPCHASLVSDGRNSFLFVVFMERDYWFLFVSITE